MFHCLLSLFYHYHYWLIYCISLEDVMRESHCGVIPKLLDCILEVSTFELQSAISDILLRHCNAVYNQNPIDRWMKGCILPFPKKGDLRLAKNYRGITLTSIAAKIYNALLRNRIEPKIDNILRKNQNVFWRNRSTTSQILTIRRILEGVQAKNHQVTLLFVDFTKAFDSIHRGKMKQILLAYGLPKETVAAITILYRNTKVKVRSPDGDKDQGYPCKRHDMMMISPVKLWIVSLL